VVCPDVVADARATLERFKIWQEAIRQTGLPLAFVGQDGAEDLDIPWENFACWFIGGSTRWKLSQASADLALEAKRSGQWLHMGRVNSLRRLQAAFDMGCDSTDGSSHSMFGDKYIYRDLAWLVRLHDQPVLWRLDRWSSTTACATPVVGGALTVLACCGWPATGAKASPGGPGRRQPAPSMSAWGPCSWSFARCEPPVSPPLRGVPMSSPMVSLAGIPGTLSPEAARIRWLRGQDLQD